MGSAIFASAFVVEVRHRAFERRFREVLEEKKRLKRTHSTPRSQAFISPAFRSAAHRDLGPPISQAPLASNFDNKQEPVREIRFVPSLVEKPPEENQLRREDEPQEATPHETSNDVEQRQTPKTQTLPRLNRLDLAASPRQIPKTHKGHKSQRNRKLSSLLTSNHHLVRVLFVRRRRVPPY